MIKKVRLPSHIKPLRYEIMLRPDLENFTFFGEATAFLNLEQPLKEIVIELDRKDMVLFHGNLLHKSTVNTSDNITYATSIRVFDTSKDPTLSSDMMVKPYKGLDIGYPELKL